MGGIKLPEEISHDFLKFLKFESENKCFATGIDLSHEIRSMVTYIDETCLQLGILSIAVECPCCCN